MLLTFHKKLSALQFTLWLCFHCKLANNISRKSTVNEGFTKKRGEDILCSECVQLYLWSYLISWLKHSVFFLYYCGRTKCYYKAILILTSTWSLTVHLRISPRRIFSVSLKWEANVSFSKPMFWTVPLLVGYWNIEQYNLAWVRSQCCCLSALFCGSFGWVRPAESACSRLGADGRFLIYRRYDRITALNYCLK